MRYKLQAHRIENLRTGATFRVCTVQCVEQRMITVFPIRFRALIKGESEKISRR